MSNLKGLDGMFRNITLLTFVICIVFSVQQNVFCQQKVDTISKIDLQDGEAMKTLGEIKAKLAKAKIEIPMPAKPHDSTDDADKNEPTGLTLNSYAIRMGVVAKSLNVEEDTRYSRKWFIELYQTIALMAKIKLASELAIENKDGKQYAECAERFENGLKFFKNLSEKPIKLTDADMKRIKEENEKVRRKVMEERALEKMKRNQNK
jgi:hypothetical protein